MPCYLIKGEIHSFKLISRVIHEELDKITRGEDVDYEEIQKYLTKYKERDRKYKDKIKKYLELLEKAKTIKENIAIAEKVRQLNIVRYEQVEEWLSYERDNLHAVEKELKKMNEELLEDNT